MTKPGGFRAIGVSLAVVAAAVAGLTGCQADPSGAGGDEQITLQFWNWMVPWESELQGAIDEFEADNPNVTVEMQQYAFAEYVPALQARLQADDDPAVYMPAALALQLAEAGRTLDLKAELGDEFIDQFYPSTNRQAEYDGGQYAVPWAAQMFGLYYNKTVFAEHGWEEPETWDDLIALAQQIRAESDLNPVAIVGNNPSQLADFFWPLISQVEDDTELAYALDALTDPDVSWDSEPVISALTQLQEVVDGGVFDPGVLSVDQDAAYASFYTGKSAMFYFSSSGLTGLEQAAPDFVQNDLGVFKNPAWSSGDRHWTGNQAGYTLSVSANLDDATEQAALEFLAFLYEPERYEAMQNRMVSLPATVASAEGIENPFVQEFAGWLLDGDGAPHISFGTGTGDAVGTGVTKIFGGQGTPEDVAEEIQRAVEQARAL